MQIHNYINELKISGLSTKQKNLFVAILAKLQEKSKKVKSDERRTVTFTYAELKRMADVKCRGDKRFASTLETFTEKVLSIKEKIEVKKGEKTKKTIFNLFSKMDIDDEENTLSVTINKDFEEFLFEVEDCYSNLNIEEYTNIKNNHTKNLYKFINQWKTKGEKEIEIEKFKQLFDIPSSYQICHLTEKIIKPGIKELKPYFKGLDFEKIKSGRKVVKIIFTWEKPSRKITKKQEEKNITAAKKLYNKEAAAEKTARVEDEIQDIKTREKLAEIVNTNLTNKTIAEKVKKITSNEYELMYQDFVKANGGVNSIHTRRGFDIMNRGKYEIISENKKAL